MRRKTFRFWTAMTVFAIANFAGMAVSAADDMVLPANPTAAKTDDKPLVIPDKIPTDPVENAKFAKQVWEKAYSSRISYTTEEKEEGGETRYFRRYNPDGTTYTRTEFITYSNKDGKELRKSIVLRNGNGRWEIYDDIAINDKWETQDDLVKNDVPLNDVPSKLEYKIRDSVFNKIPCYKVTETEDNPSLTGDDIKIVVYEIGKSNFFVYSIADYTVNGKKKSSDNNYNVKINPDLKDSLFEVPHDCKIFIAKTLDDSIRLSNLAYYKQLMRDPKLGAMMKDFYMEKYGTTDFYEVLNTGIGENYEEENETK